VGGTVILTTWLTLPEISFPRPLRIPITQVFFSHAGAPAQKLGSREATPPRPAAQKPPSVPQATVQPVEIPATIPEAPAEPPSAAGPGAGSSLGPGDPDGLPDGDLLGEKGGICTGKDCDPDGPVGLGPGIHDGSGGEDLSTIHIPGLDDVMEPVLIESSKVLPRYPELARRAGVPGQVILEAIIQADGTVSSVRILRETPPGLGFAGSAADAVVRWRYRPGTQYGRPVAVSFTVTVEFLLSR
jgi:protein TonB